MTELSVFKRGQIIGVGMKGTSVSKITELFDVARSTV